MDINTETIESESDLDDSSEDDVSEPDSGAKQLPSLLDALHTLQKSGTKPTKSPAKKKLRKRREITVGDKPAKSKPKPKQEEDSKLDELFEYSWPRCVCGMNHPPVPTFIKPDGVRCTYYWQIADMFPYMTLHRALTTEIKFQEADEDQSGLIELDELRVLLKSVFASENVSDNVVEKTFKEIDADESGTLDFSEVLGIVHSLVQRQQTNLPLVVQKNYSKACVIQ